MSAQIIAAILLVEACGEGERGIRLVADTMANRAAIHSTSAYVEATRPHQYSAYGLKDFARRAVRLAQSHREIWWVCCEVAVELDAGTYVPGTTHTHYYAHSSVTPAWASKLKGRSVVGNHTFGMVK